jgi:hypothetical protein
VAIAQHGIESIGDGDDACPERNLFTAQAPWIARTIEEFMVGEDDIGGCTRERNALLYTNVKRARFDGAMIGPTTTIPGVYAGARRERYDLEERAATAARTLHKIYVLTPNQSLRIVYANSWTGNVYMEYVADDAREQSFIRYAVFEKNSKFVNYDLGVVRKNSIRRFSTQCNIVTFRSPA